MHGAGTRNAIFDSIFFGTQHCLAIQRQNYEFLSPGLTYGVAAAVAVTVDYIVDVAVKRNMMITPLKRVDGIIVVCTRMIKQIGLRAIYRGLNVKGLEFLVSYFITGYFSVYVYKFCDKLKYWH